MDIKKMSKRELFLLLAQPNDKGESRWVNVTEFVGDYSILSFGNGGDWCRTGSRLDKEFIVLKDDNKTPGNKIDAIKLDGYKTEQSFNQYIRKDIKDYIKTQRCVMLGVKGTSTNTKIEVDHKDGRKNNCRVSNKETQRKEDFQPLCKAANDIKRQICKECKKTNKRWNAQFIKGNPYPFYEGTEEYTEDLGCKGCYQYDPVEYRKKCVEMVSTEASKQTVDYIMKKLYPDDI